MILAEPNHMMTHKQRLLMSARGEMPDRIPYAPRIDLWYNANSLLDNLPERHKGKSADQIALDEGWTLHKVVADHTRQPDPDAMLHRALGMHSLREYVVKPIFSDQVRIEVQREGDSTHIRYTTSQGSLTTATVYNDKMKRAGTSVPWIAEHLIKGPDDYRVAAGLFENMDVIPAYEGFAQWKAEVGENGLPVTAFSVAAGPMHHIQKYLIEATDFFFHYRDYQKEMRHLAEVMTPMYEKALQIVADSPAEIVNWGSNFDDMITYAPFFEKEFLPWIRQAAQVLGPKDILVLCHTDGENLGLMDLLHDSGMNVAEAVCPHPMTKVTIQEYYKRWGDKITIFGGVPSNILLPQMTPDQEFEDFMDNLFDSIAPGDHFILGIADTTPPDADFERLVRIGRMVNERGELPLKTGALRPQSEANLTQVSQTISPRPKLDEKFSTIHQDVLQSREKVILDHVKEMLEAGVDADEIIQKGMISAMQVLSQKFKDGTVFIPEVLLSARTMNQAVEFLEPYLTTESPKARGKVLIGTVKGDLHDIGKNMVAAMLRGIGLKVIDMGIDVPADKFVAAVRQDAPQVLALSALLTTTMPEMEKVIQALSEAGLRKKVKVIVGGAPINRRFAESIGADGFGRDGTDAVENVRNLIES